MTSFLFLDNIEKIQENLSKVLKTFENIMENGAFAPMKQCFIFHDIFKYIVFQRRKNALTWDSDLYSNIRHCMG